MPSRQRLRCFRLPVEATRLADGSLLTGPAAVRAAAAVKTAKPKKSTAEEMEALLEQHPLVRECVALAPAPKRSESQWNPSAACPKTAIGHRGRRFRLESVRYIVVAAY